VVKWARLALSQDFFFFYIFYETGNEEGELENFCTEENHISNYYGKVYWQHASLCLYH
jgi:hypothetical protein